MRAAQEGNAYDEYKLDKEADEAHHDEAQCGLQADLVEFCKANEEFLAKYSQPYPVRCASHLQYSVITCAGSCRASSTPSKHLHPEYKLYTYLFYLAWCIS